MSERDLIEKATELVGILRTRAGYARSEGDATAIGDALHFEAAAATIARLSEALAEAERKGAEDWQLIETAPRDGTAVIVCDPSADGQDPIVGEAYCNEARGGWWWANTSDTQLSAEPIDPPPTHWRSLPAPPRDLSQGGQHG